MKRLLLQTEDDQFFHLMCHVDESLRDKISQGGFVDLQRLLPCTRFQSASEEQKMQFVNKNIASYWIPAETDQQKISGIRTWEQAFHIYAAIFFKGSKTQICRNMAVCVCNKHSCKFLQLGECCLLRFHFSASDG